MCKHVLHWNSMFTLLLKKIISVIELYDSSIRRLFCQLVFVSVSTIFNEGDYLT